MSPAEAVAMLDMPSWEHVGALLLSHGITDGVQRSCAVCPIALFLMTVTSQIWSVGRRTAWVDKDPTNYQLPDAAWVFIRGFDSERWAS
jgi:hypothetical protein